MSVKRYTFNGEGYSSEQEANAARDTWMQNELQHARAQNADMASVGYDEVKYNALMESGGGLSQMSTKESDFIKNRYQPTSSTKYKNSVLDQYLMSVGLPPSSELSKYRTKYQEYEGAGGIKESYGSLDDRAWNKIKELWAKDWQYGLTDEDAQRRARGLAPVSYDGMYGDTRLDEELKAAGLPPSKLLQGKLGESYNEWVENDNKRSSINAQIAQEYAKHLRDNDGITLEEVISGVLTMPENIEFANSHYGIYEDLPELESDAYKKTEKKNGVTFDIKDENGDPVYDDEKWRKDYLNASMKNNKINNDEFAITPEKIQQYWDENAVYYNAERAALDYYASKGQTPTQSEFIETLEDFAIAQSINGGNGFTAKDLFGEVDMSEDELKAYQPIIDKVNQRLHDYGYNAAYKYFANGEFAADMRGIQEDKWVADYRQQFSDVPEAQMKKDSEIIDMHYDKFKTTYGMTDSEVKALRDGLLNLNEYMSSKVKDSSGALAFAKDRHARELAALGLPSTLEELKAEAERLNKEYDSIKDDDANAYAKRNEIDEKLARIEAETHNWLNTETAYYLDAASYTADFQQKTSDMNYVNEQFGKIVLGWNSALTDAQAANLAVHATDDEKRQLVYLADTTQYTEQYVPDENGNRSILSYKAQEYMNNVLMRRWDSVAKNEKLAEQGAYYNDPNASKFGKVMRAIGGTLAAVTIQPWEAMANLVSDTAAMLAHKDIYASQRPSTNADNEISLIASKISDNAGEFWSSAYQLIPSSLQSAGGMVAAYFTGGASEALTLGLMATQAYSSAVESSLLSGASTKEAFWFGIASGAAEAIFEKVSLDALTEGMRGARDVIESAAGKTRKELIADLFKTVVLKNIPVSALTEGSEEFNTGIANWMSEQFILGYDSSQEQLKRHYMDAGLSEEEAEKRVIKDNLTSVFWDFIGGLASGALMSFGSNLFISGRGLRIDNANIQEFTNSVQNLSGISYEDALSIADGVAQYDTNNVLTMQGAQAVIEALRSKGADATVMTRVVNSITDTKTQNDVMTYLNNQLAEQLKSDKIKMIEAAEKVIARQNLYGMNAADVSDFARQYVNEITEAVSKGDAKHLEQIARAMQRGFVDETIRRAGNYRRAGAAAMSDYLTTLDDEGINAVQEQAKKLRAKFADSTSNLRGDAIDNYALFAAGMMHLTGSKVQGGSFAKASSFMFGDSSRFIPVAIKNACMNSDGAGARAFVDAALEAIALHQDSDSSMLMNQLSTGMSAPQYAVSALALASQRSPGSMQRNMYDYITKRGVSESALNMLAASLRYESMTETEINAAGSDYYSDKTNVVMDSDEAQKLADEHAKLWNDFQDKKNTYEIRKTRNETAMVDSEARVARYQAEYDAFNTDTVIDENGNPIPSIPTDLKETAERTNDALQRATEARDKLAVENEGRLNDAKNEMDKAEEKLNSFELSYNNKLNRQVYAYVKQLGSFYAAVAKKDAPTQSALDRANALFTYGSAQNLNDIEKKLVAAEKTKAVSLGNALGITVEVTAFDDDFCSKFGIDTSERGFTKDGKVYVNESMLKDKTGVRAITGVGTDYVILHEFGHIAELSADQYKKYFKFAWKYMCNEYGEDTINKWVDAVAKKRGYDNAKAQREVVAEFTRTALLNDPRAIDALCKSAPKMSTRILQWLTNTKNNLFNDSMAKSSAITRAQSWYAKALKATNLHAEPAASQTDVKSAKDAYKDANKLEEIAAPKRAQAEAQAQARIENAAPVQTEEVAPPSAEENEYELVEQKQDIAADDEFYPPENYRFDEAYTESDARSYADGQEDFADIPDDDRAFIEFKDDWEYMNSGDEGISSRAREESKSEEQEDAFYPPEKYRFDEAYMEADARSFFTPMELAEKYSISKINDAYMPLARKYIDKTATKEDVKRLRALVEAAAIKRGVILRNNGRPQNLYRGTMYFDDKSKNISLTENMIYTTTDMAVASGYSQNRYMNDDPRVRQLRGKYIEDDGTDATLFENAKNILGVQLGVNSDGVYYDKVTGEPFTREELVQDIDRWKDRGIYHLYGFAGDNQYRLDAGENSWREIYNSEYGESTDEIAENARRAGYDSARIDRVYDGSESFNAGTGNMADDVVFFRSNDVKSADLVTLDDNGEIIPLNKRFDKSNPEFKYFTEFNALDKEINNMSKAEFDIYGSPHMFASSKGLLMRRLVSADGFRTGDVTRQGERTIAMIASADKFMAGNTAVIHRALTMDECVAVVIPSRTEYCDLCTNAREAGVNVVTYEDASQFNTAQERAAEQDSMSYFPTDDLTYEGFLKQYGHIPYGAEPRKNRPVPRRTNRYNRVSQALRTIMEAPLTSDEAAGNMRSWLVNNGTGTYTPQSNVKSITKARNELNKYGSLKAAAEALHGNVATGTGRNTDLVALGEVILSQMWEDGTMTNEDRERVVSDICILETDSGRATQLASVIKKMTPDGHINYMEQVGKRMASRAEKRTGKPVSLTLTEEEKQAYRNAKTQEERDLIDEEVTERFGKETVDLTWRDKMRNWRYFSMLANARTHFRNITGNVLMTPVTRFKDVINTAYQAIDVKRGSGKHPTLTQADRTTAAITRADGQTKAYTETLLKEALPIMQGVSSKYIESINSAAKSKGAEPTFWQKATADVDTAKLFNDNTRSSFWNKVARGFNKASSINSNMLELEDAAFLGLRFKSSVYQQLQAKGIDVTKITEAQKNQIMNYAMEEALRATFRDASALADAINDFMRSGKIQGAIVEGLLPFKKTPINIAKRSIEYSPLGVLQGVYKMVSNNKAYTTQLSNINNSNLSDAEKQVRIKELNNSYIKERVSAIDRLAAGTTGSILTAIGIMAASLGWISVKRKDDEADTFENGLGKNRYSLNIGNTSIDLSAFSPAAVPFIIGATIFEMTDGESDTDGTPLFSAIIGSLCEAIDPITEMSVISSFADAMGFTSYSNEEAQGTRTIFSFLGKGVSSYIGQYVPTKVGQIERTFDPYSRSYSAGEDYWASKAFGKDIGGFVKNMQNKVGLGWLLEPKMNVHGEEVTNYTNFGSWVWNYLNQNIFPASWKADNKNVIDDELVRLYGVVDNTSMFPTKPSRNVGSYTDSETRKSVPLKLTDDNEYMEYQRDYGQAIYSALEELMSSSQYQMMSDEEKSIAVENTIDSAKKAIRNVWKAKLAERSMK